jgi:hypothetical protein
MSKQGEIQPSLEELETELEELRSNRYRKEMSDDFCFSTGSIDPYIAEERRLRFAIEAMKKELEQ